MTLPALALAYFPENACLSASGVDSPIQKVARFSVVPVKLMLVCIVTSTESELNALEEAT